MEATTLLLLQAPVYRFTADRFTAASILKNQV
jgi:hypothetical protein